MTKHLQTDMHNVHRDILSLSATVEGMIDKAARSLLEMNPQLAVEVIDSDEKVDRREVRIEEECLKMLALHQPVAVDLRRIATVLKVNSDLERIADLAVNVAERAQCLFGYPQFPIPKKLERMVQLATKMVHDCLDAFVNMDSDGAREILRQDDEVDAYNREIIDELQDLMQQQPQVVVPAMHCFSASRHIERIADHAENIAEDVIYLVEGDIVRHRHDKMPLPQ